MAAYYAKEMGLPVNKLICASNDNNVLTDFINKGVYDKNNDLILTTSPSMDVLVSSNVERFLYHMSGENTSLVSTLMEELKEDGRYEIDRSILNIMDFMKAYYANEKEVNEKY